MRICAWEYVVDAINLWFETNQSAIRMATGAAAVKWTQWQQRPCAYNLCGTHHHRTGTPLVVSCETARKKKWTRFACYNERPATFLLLFFLHRFAQCTIAAHTIDSRSTKNNVLSATYRHRMANGKYGLCIRETMTNAHKSKSLHQTNKFARGSERQSTGSMAIQAMEVCCGEVWMLRRSWGWNKICMQCISDQNKLRRTGKLAGTRQKKSATVKIE